MFVDKAAADVLRSLMAKNRYTLRSFAKLTNNTTGMIQRLRQGDTDPRTCNFDTIFALLPEFKEFLDKQAEERRADLDERLNRAEEDALAREQNEASAKFAMIARDITTRSTRERAGRSSQEGAELPRRPSCPVFDTWTVMHGINATVFIAGREGIEYTREPFGYSGSPTRDGLYAVQMTSDANAPTIPMGAIVYALWSMPALSGKLHVIFFNDQLLIGTFKARVGEDAYSFSLLDGTEATVGKDALRGRVIGWTVLA